jgi:hypothetical protein
MPVVKAWSGLSDVVCAALMAAVKSPGNSGLSAAAIRDRLGTGTGHLP